MHESKNCVPSPRPLFSSLLEALPKKTWEQRDDVYESREADYIAEAEASLLYGKGHMISHLFMYFLQTKTSLSMEDITKVVLSTLYTVDP